MGLRASYIGSTMRKLLVDRDYNTLQASTVPFDPDEPGGLCAAAVPAVRLLHGHRRRTPGAASSTRLQFELLRRWRSGLAFNAAYTLANSESNAPDTGNSTIGPVQFDPYDIEKDRGPDPNVVKHRVVANATLGHSGGPRPPARREHGEAGRTRCSAAGRSRRSSRRAAART